MSKEYKYNMRNQANIFDRYAYFCMEIMRGQLYLGSRINTFLEDTSNESVKSCNEALEELIKEIKQLTSNDREFLLNDSLFYKNFYHQNKKIMEECTNLETEYTQDKPYISDKLAIWLYTE